MPARPSATDASVAMTDESWAAFHLWRWYDGDAMRALRQSAHGRALAALGFEQDLEFAAQLDSSECVPVLSREDDADVLRAQKCKREPAALIGATIQ